MFSGAPYSLGLLHNCVVSAYSMAIRLANNKQLCYRLAMHKLLELRPVRWFRGKFLNTREKQLTMIGITGVIIALICGAGIFAGGIPWRGTADAPQHMDYAWQVGHGQLPSFWDGTEAPLGNYKSSIQFVSHHPPLYYVLLAPIVTPLLDAGHWASAVAAARIFSVFIAVLCALALAWGGWVIGGKRRAMFAIATPAIATALLTFNVAGDVMNDALCMLFATLALVLSIRVVQRGLSWKYVILLSLVCLGGMASRSSFAATLAVVFLALLIGALVHGKKKDWWRNVLKAGGAAAIILAVIALGIGWFYMRNYQLSGSPFRSRPRGSASKILKLNYKTLPDVLTMPSTWDMVTVKFYGRDWKLVPRVDGRPANYLLSVIVLLYITICAGLQTWQSRRGVKLVTWIAIGLLVLQFMLVYGQQIFYAVGYGGLNRRYLLPAWLPFGLFLAVGTLYWQKLRGMAVIFVAFFGWLSMTASVVNFLIERNNVVAANHLETLWIGFTRINNIPAVILPLLGIGLIVGLSLQGVILWKLAAAHKSSPQKMLA